MGRVRKKNAKAPFVPKLNSETDLKYFDKKFIEELNSSKESDENSSTNRTIDNYLGFSYYDCNTSCLRSKKSITSTHSKDENI